MDLSMIRESSHRFYAPENIHHLAPYVKQLIAEGYPMWMVEHERWAFRTAQDTGANEGYLRCWNHVREAHGFPKLTKTELWQRQADSDNWTDEYRDFEMEWWPKWYKAHREGVQLIVPEFTGNKHKEINKS